MNNRYREIDNRLINLQAKISNRNIAHQKWRMKNWDLIKKVIPIKKQTLLGFEAEAYRI